MQKVEISYKSIIFTILFLLSLQVLWTMRELIYALFFAFILMSTLKPIVAFLEKNRFPRPIAALLVLIITLAASIFIFAFVFPPLISEVFNFAKNLPQLLNHLVPTLASSINFGSINQLLPELTQNAFGLISSLFSNYVFMISVLFFSFYFLLDERLFENFIRSLSSGRTADRIVTIFYKAEKRMSAWMWGELILMMVIGTISFIGLSLLGVRYAFPLAVIAGLFEVIPFIGPVTSAIPAFVVAAPASWILGLSVLVLYFIIQQLENNLIVPFVMQKAVGLHPIVTLIALAIGGKLGGILGIILSVPLALIIETIIAEMSRAKNADVS
jgi:predicted PurR-regulated permease PerM